MKKFKKIMAVLVAAMMIMATMVPAWADVTISISQSDAPNQASVGAEHYELYKIFDATKTTESSTVGDTSDTTVDKENDYNYTSVGPINNQEEWDSASSNGTIALYLRNTDGTFTKVSSYVHASHEGETFYKLKEDKGIVYTIDSGSDWVAVLEGAGNVWVELTETTVSGKLLVEWKNDDHSVAQTRKFAQWLLEHKGNINPTTTMDTSTSTKIASKNVSEGYWLITSTLGTELVLATTDIEIKTKNSFPTTTKEADAENYYVGDYVEYTINVVLPASTDFTKQIVVHDTMSDKLRLIRTKTSAPGDHGWSVKAGSTDLSNATTIVADNPSTSGTNEFETFWTDRASGATEPKTHDSTHTAVGSTQIFDFVLDVNALKVASGEQDAKTVTIKYYAEVLGEASIKTSIPNTEYVEYSKFKTAPATDNVMTFGFNVTKTFEGTHDNNITATFELKPAGFEPDASGTYYKLHEEYTLTAPSSELTTESQITGAGYAYDPATKSAKKYKFTEDSAIEFEKDGNTYTKADTNTVAQSANIVVTDSVQANVNGLKEGYYTFTETDTANGYKPLTAPIVIKISSAGDASIISAPEESQGFATGTNDLSVVNKTSTALPATGGMGTTVLYIVGGMLVILAGAYLFFSRKRAA